MNEPKTVADVGEFALIEAIRRNFPPAPPDEIWSGDDAAVLQPWPGPTVFTTDALVESVDFDLAYCPPASVGFKAIAVNASDVAAMGGHSRRAVATLALPASTPIEIVDGIAQGLARACEETGVDLVGGDLSSAREISLTIAMLGYVETAPVTRGGASPGDVICVTGALGGAAGGLRILKAGLAGHELEDDGPALSRLVTRQLEPTPRVKEGPAIGSLGATAMIDISDGMLADLEHVLDASGAGCRIDPEAVPVDPDLGVLVRTLSNEKTDPLELALTGGEDFELLFTIAAAREDEFRSALNEMGTPMTVIGEITVSEREVGDRNLEEWSSKGWQHLRNP